MGYLTRIGVPYLIILFFWSLIGINVWGFGSAAWILWLVVYPLLTLLTYALCRRFVLSAFEYLEWCFMSDCRRYRRR